MQRCLVVLASIVLWLDGIYGQDLCKSLGSDSVFMRVSGTLRCDALIPQDLQHGAVGKCWYSWSFNGHELILKNYLILSRSKHNIRWVYAPTSSPNDNLLSGAYYIQQGKKLIVVTIETGLISSIIVQGNGWFDKHDFAVINECQLPVVIQTVGMYHGWFGWGKVGWQIDISSTIHNSDGTISFVNGNFSDSIRSRLNKP